MSCYIYFTIIFAKEKENTGEEKEKRRKKRRQQEARETAESGWGRGGERERAQQRGLEGTPKAPQEKGGAGPQGHKGPRGRAGAPRSAKPTPGRQGPQDTHPGGVSVPALRQHKTAAEEAPGCAHPWHPRPAPQRTGDGPAYHHGFFSHYTF